MKTEKPTLLSQLREAVNEVRTHGIDHLERHGLAVHEFTALFPLAPARGSDPDAALNEALQRFAQANPSPFAAVPGLHAARWALLQQIDPSLPARDVKQDLPPPPAKPAASGPLLLAFVCDGEVLDVLEELVLHAAPALDAILSHCDGYAPGGSSVARFDYLRKHRLRSGYLVRDTRQLDPSAPHLHPSAREITRALALREQLLELTIANQGRTPEQQQQAFQAFRRGGQPRQGEPIERGIAVGYPFALSPFERPLDCEGLWVRRAADMARAVARRDARKRTLAGLQPRALRGVHAKHHGLLEARFKVRSDLPARLRHGVFVPGAEYDAFVRPSNSAARETPDLLPDARGLGIKLRNVSERGEPALEQAIPDGIGPVGLTQDFTLVSHPTFFAKNARDYVILRSLVDCRPDGAGEKLGLAARIFTFAARRRTETGIFLRTLLRLCRHPLALEYHSLLPIMLGPNEAVKFSVRPTEATRRILMGDPLRARVGDVLRDPRDSLRLALQRSLDLLGGTQLEFEFALHIAGEQRPPVEDPRIDWAQAGAERVVVATLTIAAQDATSPSAMDRAERMVINPWHALAAHRPLGSLNRARLFSYLASAEERGRKNPGLAPNQQNHVLAPAAE